MSQSSFYIIIQGLLKFNQSDGIRVIDIIKVFSHQPLSKSTKLYNIVPVLTIGDTHTSDH